VAESQIGAQTCDLLEWDSTFFGYQIARYRGSRCAGEDVTSVLAECAERQIDCVYINVDVSDTKSVAALQAGHALFVDARVTLGGDVAAVSVGMRGSDDGMQARPAVEADMAALTAIASTSHRETRFYADSHFAVTACDRLYETWIERSCHGYADVVFVTDEGTGRASGYITCHRDEAAAAHIGLFAVADEARGLGVGRRLLDAALRWCAAHDIRSLSVATQGRNLRALQFYGRAGFLVTAVQLCFHLWPRDVRA
jgi:dTDP-4-amino-4,6-dideoxy-D-galactose acyltransferase